MFVVAIGELASSVDAEAALLAADLGTTVYEERLKLAGMLPAIVLTSADRPRAHVLYSKLVERGHCAFLVDATTVVPHTAMVSLRRFTLEADAMVATDGADDPAARLPWADLAAILRATHDTQTATRSETSTQTFSASRALLSGGVMVTKKVTREETSVASDREQVLYLFRASGRTPWILRERGTHYTGLGAQRGPASLPNFLATLARVRAAAPDAIYDERLMKWRSVPKPTARSVGSGTESISVSSASGVDLMAHLLAQTVTRIR